MTRRSLALPGAALAALLAGNVAFAQTTPQTPAADATKPAPDAATAPAEAPKPVVAPKPEEPKKTPPTGLTIAFGDTSIKFGLLLQAQADWSQDAASGGYAQNLGLRRTRFNIAGNVTKNVYFFFQTENSRLGFSSGTTKTISSGFQMQDAVLEWRIAKAFNIWGGLIYLPTSREALKSSATQFMLDQSNWAYTATGALAGTGGRDTGFLARGYFVDDRLEYRVGVFQGIRENGSRNAYRTIGRLQYNFFDKEVYNLPAYAGSNLGTKTILAVGAAVDYQMDYRGVTADVFADFPTSFGSVVGTATFQRLDGGVSVAALPRSNIFQIDAGAYLKASKIGPWLRYEQRSYSYVTGKDEKRWLGGVNYYIKGHNANLKAAYGRVSLDAPGVRDTNQFVLQLQGYM